jgi:membrane protease YdiL (CAAX protease family)
MAHEEHSTALRQSVSTFGMIAALTLVLTRLEPLVPLVRDNVHLLVGALFLITALRRAEALPGGLARYGLRLGGVLSPDDDARAGGVRDALADLATALWRALPELLTEAGVASAVCAVVFPPFVVAFYYWNAPMHPFVLAPQSDLGSYIATQIIVVALPEEALFRGYLQGRLHEAWPERRHVLGVSLCWRAWLLQAALFALLHFAVDFQPVRLAVFFPALLFGWLAALRGGIGAAIFVHALCNLLSDLLVRGFL